MFMDGCMYNYFLDNTLEDARNELKNPDEFEKKMYDNIDNGTFYRKNPKSHWGTNMCMLLDKCEHGYYISRAGDALLNTTLQVVLPKLKISKNNIYGDDGVLEWKDNIGHRYIKKCSFTGQHRDEKDIHTFQQFDKYDLDMTYFFNTPDGKKQGYERMINNKNVVYLPMPFFYLHTPLPPIPYTDLYIKIEPEDWTNLVVLKNKKTGETSTPTIMSVEEIPELKEKILAEYTIVNGDTRKKMVQGGNHMIKMKTVRTIYGWDIIDKKVRVNLLRGKEMVQAILFACIDKNNNYVDAFESINVGFKINGNGGSDSAFLEFWPINNTVDITVLNHYNILQSMYNPKGVYIYPFTKGNPFIPNYGTMMTHMECNIMMKDTYRDCKIIIKYIVSDIFIRGAYFDTHSVLSLK